MDTLLNTSNAGRNKIDRTLNLNPHAKMIVVCGMKEIGKSHQAKIDIRDFIKAKQLPVLIYDINADDYPEYPITLPHHVLNITKAQIRRVVPFDTNGKQMNTDQKRELLYYVLDNFRNGFLVLDDIDKYCTGVRGQEVIGMLTTNRHSGFDLMIQHQSLGKVTTTEWENINILKLFHQVDPVEQLKDRKIPNFTLLKIGQLLVDNVYFAAMKLMRENMIGMKNFLELRGYFVVINWDEHRIYNCAWSQFEKAMKQFLNLNQKQIRDKMLIGDDNDNKLSRDGAIKALIQQYSEYFGG